MRPSNSLRATALGLRTLATKRAAEEAIRSACIFGLGGVVYTLETSARTEGDRCVPHPVTGQCTIEARALSPMELIDDACAFETIAYKLDQSHG